MQRLKMAGVMILFAALATPTFAEWPNLNPFSSTKKTTGASKSWLPTWGKSTPRQGPTTWQKMQAAPGNAYRSTKETLAPLNPFKGEPAKTSSYSSKKESSSWWPSWGEEKPAPNSVSDWLDNPRPE